MRGLRAAEAVDQARAGHRCVGPVRPAGGRVSGVSGGSGQGGKEGCRCRLSPSPGGRALPARLAPAAPERCLLLNGGLALPSAGRGTYREAREENASPKLRKKVSLLTSAMLNRRDLSGP